jgi:1-acyl-sn-glycerol-3-phosphate acyltransferase
MDYTPSASELRAGLLAHVLEFAGEYTPAQRAQLSTAVSALLETASETELTQTVERLRCEEFGFCYHAPIVLVKRIHHAMAEVLLAPESHVEGGERLAPIADRSLILLPNHLSYADANLIEVLLHRAGFDRVCSRLTVVAGPKVYTRSWRRFASACFGTIKTAQSSQVASGDAVMRPRDVARIARETIACAHERLSAGDALLLFGEGSRSRDATLQPLLPAVARYCDRPDLWLVPCGIVGTEKFLGFADVRPQTTQAVLRIGTPVLATDLVARCQGNRSELVQALGNSIAQSLPAAYRGVYAHPVSE